MSCSELITVFTPFITTSLYIPVLIFLVLFIIVKYRFLDVIFVFLSLLAIVLFFATFTHLLDIYTLDFINENTINILPSLYILLAAIIVSSAVMKSIHANTELKAKEIKSTQLSQLLFIKYSLKELKDLNKDSLTYLDDFNYSKYLQMNETIVHTLEKLIHDKYFVFIQDTYKDFEQMSQATTTARKKIEILHKNYGFSENDITEMVPVFTALRDMDSLIETIQKSIDNQYAILSQKN